MKNLKKTLAVVLAFVMVLSMGAISTFAYTDVEAGTLTDEAVSILSSLDIITGFEDGTFRPEETVTRAQMAAIICRALGYEEQAESSMGFTVFNDVAGDHWASGYVNVAQAQGIINGYGNGNFGPEDKVTYEQAVKMIVAALGYDLAAQSKGGYPTGYLAIASAEGITKGANGRVGDAAKRATVAVLVYNSLEVQLMDQTSWSTGTEGDKYEQTDRTILSQYLDVIKVEAVVTDAPLTYAEVANAYDKEATPQVTMDGERFRWSNDSYGGVAWSGTVDASLVDANALLGKKVVAYVGANEDKETGHVMVYAMAEKQGANEVTVINANQLITSGADYTAEGQISYKKDGSSRVTDVNLAGSVEVFVNYEVYGDTVLEGGDNDGTISTDDMDGVITNGGVIELISNNNDSVVDYIIVTAYGNEAVIKDVTDDEGILIYDAYAGSLNEIDTEDEETLVVVYKDGAIADAKAIAANDTVSEIVLAGGDIRVLYVSSKTVTGKVDSYDDNKNMNVEIAGDYYRVSNAFIGLGTEAAAIAGLEGEEGTFFLNVDGQIAHNETDAVVSGNYAYVLSVYYEGGNTDGYTAQVVTSDGTVAIYDIASKAKFITSAGSETGDADFEVAGELAKAIAGTAYTQGTTTEAQVETALGTVDKLAYANRANAMFKVRIKDDKITRVEALAAPGTSNASKEFNAEAMTYQGWELDEDIVVFNVKTGITTVTDEDVTVGTVKSFFVDGEGYAFRTYDVEDAVPAIILGDGLKANILQDSAAVIVTSKRTITYDEDRAIVITGIQAGETVTYTLYDEDAGIPANASTLEAGDVILVASAVDGVVDEIEVLHNAYNTKAANASAAASRVTDTTNVNAFADEIANGYGLLDVAKTTNKVFALDSAAIATTVTAGTYTFATAGEEISMRSAANYTLVDYSKDASEPTISKKAPSTAFSKSASYQSEVFVRVYDGVIVDVVVYRYSAV